jgi:uncharacterized protein
MDIGVASAVAESIRLQQAPGPINVIWHGGEPLALGADRFERLLAPFETLRREGSVSHTVQTSAGLITPRWCELLRAHDIAVGVSIDGPPWANVRRRDKSGRSTHERTMTGIDILREHMLEFTVIAVVTPETINHADTLIDFFEELSPARLGFNLEEHEGANTRRPPIDREAALQFWYTLFRRSHSGTDLRLRDTDRLLSYLRGARNGNEKEKSALHDPIPTVSWSGDTVLLSPELAGIHAPEYGDFIVGNVLRESLPSILQGAHRFKYVDEFVRALSSCAGGCEFYDFCKGAQAGNRYFEHGRFTETETSYCVNTRQSLVRALEKYLLQGMEP